MDWQDVVKTPYNNLLEDAKIGCNCPICDKQMIRDADDFDCKNGCLNLCFWVSVNDKGKYVDMCEITIFKKSSFLYYEEVNQIEEAQLKIDYWKENYRYLAEILERA